ncbi:MAG: polysaccharide deacetylase family protein [Acidimicrobiales bacterium]
MPPITVLLYHRVDGTGSNLATPPGVFEKHMAWLASSGFTTLTSAELDRALVDDDAVLPRRPLVLTFDDGTACLERQVEPVLERHGFTGVGFVITGRTDGGTPGDLSWEAVRRLDRGGVMEISTHSHSHLRWPLRDDEAGAVMDDLGRSRRLLAEHLDRPESSFTHLAWPFGRTNPAWESAAVDAGFTTQYVVQRGAITHRHQSVRLPRLMADGMSTSVLASWVSLLSRSGGARLGNEVFGRVRESRQGAAYR